VETKYVFEGLTFTDVEYKRCKRSFRVEKVAAADEAAENPPDAKQSPSIPAYVMTETSTIKLLTETIPEPSKKKGSAVGHKADEEKPKATVLAKTGKTAAKPVQVVTAPSSNITFGSIGGLSSQIESLRSLLMSMLEDADEFARKGLVPPRGILLYGPPGTGKTMMLKAAACEMKVKSYILDGKVMGKYMGESEAAIRKIFDEARKNQPSIIFMDEVDSLAPKRSQGEGSEGRVVATLLTEMDGLESPTEDGTITRVAIVAATNRPNAIDEALRRAGRFEKEVEIGIPDVDARREILGLLMRKLDFESDPSKSKEEFVTALASRTHGYVGADLEAVVRGGFTLALERRRNSASVMLVNKGSSAVTITNAEKIEVTLRETDLEMALKGVKPTAMREIFLEAPKVRWSDIGGQEEVKQRLREAVEWPLTHPEVFARLGGTPRKGLLLYGPPGCSKTLTAKALATEAGLNFMAVKGPELFSMYVGESERAVREIFRKARAASPSIIFFDEIDALGASREGGKGGGVNVLTALLNEMDGIETLNNVVILAATNRPEIIVNPPSSCDFPHHSNITRIPH
jgi:AAA family ATPase